MDDIYEWLDKKSNKGYPFLGYLNKVKLKK